MKTDETCLFCKIVAGGIPATKIYEDEKTLAFLDIRPVHHGHSLVIPKEHVENIFEMTASAWGEVQETVRKTAVAIEKGLSADGVNLAMNNREHAGQVIFHAHVHVIPRVKGDNLKHWPSKNYSEGEEALVAEKIIGAL